jgi:predicted metal-dependent RNase
MIRSGKDPFRLPELHFTRDASESMALNRIRAGAVIMAGSGMCTGGRVRHHLRHNLAHSDCSVIFVGYAAEGTLARIIIDGAKSSSSSATRSRCGRASTRSTASPPMPGAPSFWTGTRGPAGPR